MKLLMYNLFQGFRVLFNPKILNDKIEEYNNLGSLDECYEVVVHGFKKKLLEYKEKFPNDSLLLQEVDMKCANLETKEDVRLMTALYTEVKKNEENNLICPHCNKQYIFTCCKCQEK